MNTTTIETTINGTTYTARIPHEAMRSAEWAGVDVAADIRRLASGEVTTEALLAECLDGADDDRVSGWRSYVSSLSAAVSL